jgi:hypothetical protein
VREESLPRQRNDACSDNNTAEGGKDPFHVGRTPIQGGKGLSSTPPQGNCETFGLEKSCRSNILGNRFLTDEEEFQ